MKNIIIHLLGLLKSLLLKIYEDRRLIKYNLRMYRVRDVDLYSEGEGMKLYDRYVFQDMYELF